MSLGHLSHHHKNTIRENWACVWFKFTKESKKIAYRNTKYCRHYEHRYRSTCCTEAGTGGGGGGSSATGRERVNGALSVRGSWEDLTFLTV
jgi:hypothetical protein